MAAEVSLSGVGLHSGQPAEVIIGPGAEDEGIVFLRSTPGGEVEIPATLASLVDSNRCTGLEGSGERIETVEHLLAALYGLGVDNARVRIEGPEVPILDGSSLPFVQSILQVGVVEMSTPPRYLRLTGTVVVNDDNGACALARPFGRGQGPAPTGGSAERFSLISLSEFRPPVGRSLVWLGDVEEAFCAELAPARTPGFIEEKDPLQGSGRALGAGQENVLVVLADRYLNEPRFPDEVGRHKALDLVGDLSLVGARLVAEVVAVRPGHRLNQMLARALIQAGELRAGGSEC